MASSPPLPCTPWAPETLAAFLDARQVDGELQAILLSHAAAQRQRMAAILETGEVVDELSVLSQGSFDQHPPALDVSGRLLRERPVLYLSGISDPPPGDPSASPPATPTTPSSAPPLRLFAICKSSCEWVSGPWCPRERLLPSTLSSAIPGCGRRWSGSSRRWWSDVCCKTKNKRSQVGTLVCFCVLPYQHHSRYYDATAAV